MTGGVTPSFPRSSGRSSSTGRWGAFGAASLVFFFLNAATFTTLGVVLFTMGAALHWSMTAAGMSFTVLGLACGLSSPLAAVAMVRLGARGSLTAGAGLLAVGFFLASISQSLWLFYAAMILLGVGFTLSGNVPGVYVLAAWFGRSASRIIGYYLMLGALGAAFGPPVVVAIVRLEGWRMHWRIMAVAAAVIGAVCLLLVRDPPGKPARDPLQREPGGDDDAELSRRQAGSRDAGDWTSWQAVMAPQFLLVCASMIMTMACVTTNSSILVSHLVRLGSTQTAAAFVLSAGAITATLVKGGSGRLCELVTPSILLAMGLVLQAVGCVLLAGADTTVRQYASALTFGTGWGLAFVSCTILPLAYFGAEIGGRILAVMALLSTFAAAGPLAAGMIADRTGGFGPIYLIYAGLLLVLAVPILLMRAPNPAAIPGALALRR